MFKRTLTNLNAVLLASFGEGIAHIRTEGGTFNVSGVVDRGAAFERAHPGLYGSVFTLLSNFPSPPKAGDEIQVGDAICQVVNEMDRDTFGGITLYARFVRLAP